MMFTVAFFCHTINLCNQPLFRTSKFCFPIRKQRNFLNRKFVTCQSQFLNFASCFSVAPYLFILLFYWGGITKKHLFKVISTGLVTIQVSLAIRGGYILEKNLDPWAPTKTANNQKPKYPQVRKKTRVACIASKRFHS